VLVSVAAGPDGLYFAPLFADRIGESAIFRVIYDPEDHPFATSNDTHPVVLMQEYSCLGCHTLNGSGGGVAPPLDSDVLVPALEERLNSADYRTHVQELNGSHADPEAVQARRAVLAAEGLDRVRTWLAHRIMQPDFDDPSAEMPALGVSEGEALSIAKYLAPEANLVEEIKRHLPSGRREQLAVALVVGFLGGGLTLRVGQLLYAWYRRQRR
jgi:mono/diheme cytochrome c family protein